MDDEFRPRSKSMGALSSRRAVGRSPPRARRLQARIEAVMAGTEELKILRESQLKLFEEAKRLLHPGAGHRRRSYSHGSYSKETTGKIKVDLDCENTGHGFGGDDKPPRPEKTLHQEKEIPTGVKEKQIAENLRDHSKHDQRQALAHSRRRCISVSDSKPSLKTVEELSDKSHHNSTVSATDGNGMLPNTLRVRDSALHVNENRDVDGRAATYSTTKTELGNPLETRQKFDPVSKLKEKRKHFSENRAQSADTILCNQSTMVCRSNHQSRAQAIKPGASSPEGTKRTTRNAAIDNVTEDSFRQRSVSMSSIKPRRLAPKDSGSLCKNKSAMLDVLKSKSRSCDHITPHTSAEQNDSEKSDFHDMHTEKNTYQNLRPIEIVNMCFAKNASPQRPVKALSTPKSCQTNKNQDVNANCIGNRDETSIPSVADECSKSGSELPCQNVELAGESFPSTFMRARTFSGSNLTFKFPSPLHAVMLQSTIAVVADSKREETNRQNSPEKSFPGTEAEEYTANIRQILSTSSLPTTRSNVQSTDCTSKAGSDQHRYRQKRVGVVLNVETRETII